MKFELLARNGEPGGDRRRHPERNGSTYSFRDVQCLRDLLILRDSRTLPYAYSTRTTPEVAR